MFSFLRNRLEFFNNSFILYTPARYKISRYSTSSSTFDVKLLNFDHSNMCDVFIVVTICTFLMASDVEHCVMSLITIYVTYFVKSIHKTNFWIVRVLNTFWIQGLCEIYVLHVFSTNLCLAFLFLVFLMSRRFYLWQSLTYEFFFVSMFSAFIVYLYSPSWRLQIFCCFLLEGL